MTEKLIVGLVGNPKSGKSALAQYLADQHGFYSFEGSAGIRELAEAAGASLSTREDYSDFHRLMQKKYGPAVLAERLLARPEERLVFGGLRSVHNARRIQESGGVVIALHCPVELRFSRTTTPGLTIEAFRADEENEFFSPDGYGSDPGHVYEIADYHLNTALPVEETHRALDTIIGKLREGIYPS